MFSVRPDEWGRPAAIGCSCLPRNGGKGLTSVQMGEEVARIRARFLLSRGELARSLDVSFNTVSRWEQGTPPTGIHRAVLLSLDRVACSCSDDRPRAAVIGALLQSGVASLVEFALTRHRRGPVVG